jgi:hypothetical protein
MLVALIMPPPAVAADTVAVIIELRVLNGEMRVRAKQDAL